MTNTRTFTGPRLAGVFDPDSVAEKLGLIPDTVQRRGDLRPGRNGRRYNHDYWGLSTPTLDDEEIEPHLNWLLDLIEPRAAQLEEIRASEVSAVLDCAWNSIGMGGGPWISPEAMSRLGALNLPLIISFYSHEQPEAADSGPDNSPVG